MRCDGRLEVRLPAGDKVRATQHADAARLTLSDFVRHLIDASLNGRPPASGSERAEVESLRQRVNRIHSRLLTLAQRPDVPFPVASALKAIESDLTTAHADAQELLKP